MNPKISILMPVYNGGEFISEAINSILGQTFTDFELIIVDDGSCDNSAEVIKSYNDQRIVFKQNAINKGLSATLNIAIESSISKYIARMDQDDISLPNRLEEQYKFMENNPAIGISGTDIEMFNQAGSREKKFPVKNDNIKSLLLFNNPFAHPTIIARKEIFDKHNLRYDSNFDGAEDYDLWERMSDLTEMQNIPKVLLRYRLHQTQLSRISPTKLAKVEKIKKRQFEKLGIEENNLIGLFINNLKAKKYNNFSLLKLIIKSYKENIKTTIRQKLSKKNAHPSYS